MRQAGVKDISMNSTCAFCPAVMEMALVCVSLCVFMSVSMYMLEEGSVLEQAVDLYKRREEGGVSEYLREEGMSDGRGHM